ncbi:MAG: Coenzyme F420 hydrogenase/dehydrogenase, beta subunit C-terminal domain [Prolixibacteraceae bacterium]
MNINYTIKNNLCTGCGICEGACPTSSISMSVKNGIFIPVLNGDSCISSNGCHRCYDTCPGIGIDLQKMAEKSFYSPEIQEDEKIGKYINCYTGHSNEYDIRYHCASGGVLSQFLIWLLEKKIIDGAVVTSFDPNFELWVNSYIAKSKEEILAAKSSKYAPVTLNQAIDDIKKDEGKKFVIVGLPCHIHGFRKYEVLDKKFKDKILGYFGIYCSSGRSFNMTEYIFNSRSLPLQNLSYFSYRDEGCLGSMKIVYTDSLDIFKEEYTSYYKLRSIFVPHRCMFCIDHFNELSDVSFGDIHISPYKEDKIGINSIVSRTPFFDKLLNDAAKENIISLNLLDKDTLIASQIMSKKKERNGTFMKVANFLGQKTPSYDYRCNDKQKVKSIVAYFHTKIQMFVGFHKSLWFLIPLIKNK